MSAAVLLAVLVTAPDPVVGQTARLSERWRSADGLVTFVVSEGTTVSESWAASLYEVVERNRTLPGIPPSLMGQLALRLTLATALRSSVDGVAHSSAGVIALPVPRAEAWTPEYLERVYRHELAHLAVARLLTGHGVPQWFDEGFAEWAEGGLTCQQEAQLKLDARTRARTGVSLPSLVKGMTRSELSYAYYATGVQFLDVKSAGAVSAGTWLEEVAEHGFPSMITRLAGGTRPLKLNGMHTC